MRWLSQQQIKLLCIATFLYSLLLAALLFAFRDFVFETSEPEGLRIVLAILTQSLLLLLSWQLLHAFHAPSPVIMYKKLIYLFMIFATGTVFGPLGALGIQTFGFRFDGIEKKVGAISSYVDFGKQNLVGLIIANGLILTLLAAFYSREKRLEPLVSSK